MPEDEQAKTAARDIASFDTVLLGRRTYELFEGFWRHAADDSSTAPVFQDRPRFDSGQSVRCEVPWGLTD